MEKDKIIELLELFNEKAEKLMDTRLAKTIFQKDYGIIAAWTLGSPVLMQKTGPRKESIEAFIPTYRLFIQKKERISIRNIAKIYGELNVSPDIKKSFIEIKENVNTFLDSKSNVGVDLEMKTKRLTHRDLQKIFIDGDLAHVDEEKRKIYEYLARKPNFHESVINEFVYILDTILRAIQSITKLNQKVLLELT